MNTLLISLALLFFPQNLPTYGNISELRGLSRVYIAAHSTDARNSIIKELKKNPALSVVNSESEAQFFIETKVIAPPREPIGGIMVQSETVEMTVYTLADNKRRIAWSKTKASMRPPVKLLVGDFLGALKKDSKLAIRLT